MKLTVACDKLVREIYEKMESISCPSNLELESWVKSSLYGLVDQLEVIRRDVVDSEELEQSMVLVEDAKIRWLSITRDRVRDLHSIRREYREVMLKFLEEKRKLEVDMMIPVCY